jgi:hypothetical protein
MPGGEIAGGDGGKWKPCTCEPSLRAVGGADGVSVGLAVTGRCTLVFLYLTKVVNGQFRPWRLQRKSDQVGADSTVASFAIVGLPGWATERLPHSQFECPTYFIG